MQEMRVQSLGQEDPLEKNMATHSNTLAWEIPWTEEPGGLQAMESQRVGHYWVTDFLFSCEVVFDSSLPVDCSTPGFPVPQYLPEFAQVHVHCIGDDIQLSHPLMPSSSLNLSQHHGLFQWVGCSLLIILSSLYSCWWELLIINECWILSNVFLHIFWDDHVVFVFPFVNVMYHIDWFAYVKPFLWLWNESNMIIVYDPFKALLDLDC